MEIKRFDTLDAAPGTPLIEIRDVGAERFLLAVAIDDDDATYLDGPYPSAEIAEREGIAIAMDQGVMMLNVVHTKG